LITLLIDLAIIGVVVFCAWRGFKSGLIRGVFGVVTLVVALIFANIAANAYSEEFTGMLTPFVGGIVDTALAEMVTENIAFEEVEHENESDEFRSAYTVLRMIGLPVSAAIRVAEQAVDEETDESLSDVIAARLSSAMAFIAVFGIAFILLAIVFAVIGNLISIVFALPGLKLVDIIAGVAFGVVKGLLIVLAIATVVRYYGLLAVDMLESTTVLNYLANNNFVANLLGK
jgi:uncharacterized membrane protein required for colicin V production